MMTSPAKTTVRLRAAATLTGAGLAFAMLAGCSPQPEPTPTGTPLFASEEEAFAAAEETYQAYTQALNNVDISDPDTFESVYEHTTGDFRSRDKKNLTSMHAEEYVMTGATTVVKFDGEQFDAAETSVTATVCIDVSQTDIQNSKGASVVPADRPGVFGATVIFVEDAGRLLVTRADPAEDGICTG